MCQLNYANKKFWWTIFLLPDDSVAIENLLKCFSLTIDCFVIILDFCKMISKMVLR